MGDLKTSGSITSRLISGIVLYHSKDKREVAYNAKSVKKDYKVTLLYTGFDEYWDNELNVVK